MEEATSQLSDRIQVGIPDKWAEHFVIKRIDEEPIEITLKEQQAILENLARGQRYIQVGKYTIMLNSIKSIDPRYEPDNIPPCPERKTVSKFNVEKNTYIETITNQDERDLWVKLFGESAYKSKLLT